ncbi:DUF3866 family protein [Paenibacillus sp. SYP-B3998]|uniref:DUF3866 family protein n=1 Tax=Paenibacillus sp. SYP-B3998 TaxID=2678564 RepID=A0A6G3ZVM6_9BACL|nr:DUF3866 family protein [Paenibacillus sp. SYP-B3998]NEW06165.1 DUF3866 family protein [Paenibacillus sp. SYP-B3998]
MIDWDQGIVMESMLVRVGLQVVLVRRSDGNVQPAVHYTDSLPVLAPGDCVLLNVTAVQLGLGSGGYHFVAALLASNKRLTNSQSAGHIMKMKYTPLQRAVRSVEEPVSPYHDLFQGDVRLDGLPVLLGELHSMLPVAICWLRYRNRGLSSRLRIAYIMTDGGALPMAWSEHVAELERLEWLETTITYGQAYGGKLEAVNKFSALLAAKHAAQADLCMVTMGPGMVGTGTKYGHAGLEIGELVNAVHALGGRPIVIPRVSFKDRRERHRGISHHTLTALQLAARCPAVIPFPLLTEEEEAIMEPQMFEISQASFHKIIRISTVASEEVKAALQMYPKAITSMGRELSQDFAFFQTICAAAEWAWHLHNQSR